MVQNNKTETSGSLLSRSTILILSSFLAGWGLRGDVPAQLQVHVFATAAVGVLAYFFVDKVSRDRQKAAHREALQRAKKTLERRMEAHITPARPNAALLEPRPEKDLTLYAIMRG